MNLKKTGIISLAVILSLGTAISVVSANKDIGVLEMIKNNSIIKDQITGKIISQDEDKQIKDSMINEKSKETAKKVEKMLNETWKEVKQSYNIDEENYIKLTLDDLIEPTDEVKIQLIKDQEIAKQISEINNDLPVGSTEPTILIKKDKSEVAFAYKDNDGNNILYKSEKIKKDEWKKDKKNIKGKPKLDINSIKID